MVWIALEPTVFDHRKTLALSVALGVRETHLVGHLARLWTWALASAPTGEITGVVPDVIARAADWTGDLLEIANAAAFVGALVEVGFLDELESGGYCLHGWRERHEEWAARREAEERGAEDREERRKQRQREAKAASRARLKGELSGDGPEDVAGLSGDGPDLSTDGHRTDDDPSGDLSGPVRVVSTDGPVTVLARPDRTGPDRDRTSPDRTGRSGAPLPPIAMGGAPQAPRLRGVFIPRGNGRGVVSIGDGVPRCPAGCVAAHGGPHGLGELAEMWRGLGEAEPWPMFARLHGRVDVEDQEVLSEGERMGVGDVMLPGVAGEQCGGQE